MGQTTGAGASCVGVEQTLPIIKSELTTRGGSRQPSKRHDFKHPSPQAARRPHHLRDAFRADHYAEAGSLDELEAHLAEANANGLPVHFLGAGANTIAMSRVPGMTIRITIKGVEMSAAPNGDVLVKCGAGEVFDDIVARTLKAGIGGLENLSAIPGTVGGAVVQNIGAYGVELAERLSSVTVYDRAEKVVRVLTVEECDFSYRHSIMKTEAGRNFVVLSVTLRFPPSGRLCWATRTSRPRLRPGASRPKP